MADVSVAVSGRAGSGGGPVGGTWHGRSSCGDVEGLAHWCRCTMGMSGVRACRGVLAEAIDIANGYMDALRKANSLGVLAMPAG